MARIRAYTVHHPSDNRQPPKGLHSFQNPSPNVETEILTGSGYQPPLLVRSIKRWTPELTTTIWKAVFDLRGYPNAKKKGED